MKQKTGVLHISMTIAAVLIPLASLHGAAQQAPAASPRVQTRPASEVLAQLGRSAGVVILADSTVQGRLPAPAQPAAPARLEEQLQAMVRLLPPGTTWTKLYAPTPANGRWVAELVADYARAQARLVGSTGRPAPEGTVELLGRYVPVARANELAEALNLKQVYLVTNPRALAAVDPGAAWARLTPAQQSQYVEQQAQRLLALDPASRLDVLRRMMALPQEPDPTRMIMKTVISQMPREEQLQLKQAVGKLEKPDSGK